MTCSPPNGKGASGKKEFGFPKDLRLSGKKKISELFNDGSFFYLGAFKIYYSLVRNENNMTPGLLISVPKSKVPKAHARNKVKRRIREAYRLNKHILLDAPDELTLEFDKLGLIYLSKGLLPFGDIQDKLKLILKRLASIRNEKNEKD